jgi:hypothetical protein
MYLDIFFGGVGLNESKKPGICIGIFIFIFYNSDLLSYYHFKIPRLFLYFPMLIRVNLLSSNFMEVEHLSMCIFFTIRTLPMEFLCASKFNDIHCC